MKVTRSCRCTLVIVDGKLKIVIDGFHEAIIEHLLLRIDLGYYWKLISTEFEKYYHYLGISDFESNAIADKSLEWSIEQKKLTVRDFIYSSEY